MFSFSLRLGNVCGCTCISGKAEAQCFLFLADLNIFHGFLEGTSAAWCVGLPVGCGAVPGTDAAMPGSGMVLGSALLCLGML